MTPNEPTRPTGALPASAPAGTMPKRLALLAATAIASVAAWTGAPLFAVWVGSHLQEGTQPKMGAVAGVVIVLAVCEFVLVTLLSYLNERYDRISGRRPPTRRPPPWHSSARGERDNEIRRQEGVTPVERVVAISCGAAFLAFEIWFFFFAGSSIPNA
jgi:hypothetical protein